MTVGDIRDAITEHFGRFWACPACDSPCLAWHQTKNGPNGHVLEVSFDAPGCLDNRSPAWNVETSADLAHTMDALHELLLRLCTRAGAADFRPHIYVASRPTPLAG